MRTTAAIASIALAGGLAASAASAHDSYSHSTGTVHVPSYSTTYTAPTVDLGPIEYVQPNSTVQYIQPATTTTYSYTQPTYTAPTYTAPTYTAPAYTAPTYAPPSYVAPYYDASARVAERIERQRNRIRAARDRGDLRRGERKRLRRNMREIRDLFDSYRAYDGVIDPHEFAILRDKLNEQSRRIRRLANNHRVEGPLVSPYGHGHGYYRY